MAIQTLNTIKNWFKTGLKPSQQQFWDTLDSFRHKFEKVPVKDIEGIDELLLTKADKTVLDNHLADKNAHAPQVNTDWNSESGFSQLINKPEFKTINGEEIVGEGDITVSGGDSRDLQSILDVNNRATQGNSADGELTISMSGSEFEAINQRNSFSRSSSIIRNNAYYLQLSNYLQPSSGSANNISAQFRVEAGEASIEQSINGFNGQNTVVKFQRPERKDVTLLFPAKRANGEYTIATLDDITGGSQNLDQTVDNGNTVIGNKKKIILKTSEDIETNTTEIQAGYISVGNGDLSKASIGFTGGDSDTVSGVLNLNQVGSDGATTINNSLSPNPNSITSLGNIDTNTFYLPLNIEGDTTPRTLATTKDISLQKVVDNTALAYRGQSYSAILAGPDKISETLHTNEGAGTDASPLAQSKITQNNYISLSAGITNETDNSKGSVLSLQSEALTLALEKGANRTTVNFRTPTNVNTELYFPSLPYTSEGYNLATTKDITLQRMVDGDPHATKGASFANILGFGGYGVGTNIYADNEQSGTAHRVGALVVDTEYAKIENNREDFSVQTNIELNNGNISLVVKKDMLNAPKFTTLTFEQPTAPGIEVLIPAKPARAEAYVLATREELIPKINRISDDFTIPAGYANRFITFPLGAVGKNITLPPASATTGSTFTVTGHTAGFNYLVPSGGAEILYQGVLYDEYEIGRGVTFISDGVSYIIVSKFP